MLGIEIMIVEAVQLEVPLRVVSAMFHRTGYQIILRYQRHAYESSQGGKDAHFVIKAVLVLNRKRHREHIGALVLLPVMRDGTVVILLSLGVGLSVPLERGVQFATRTVGREIGAYTQSPFGRKEIGIAYTYLTSYMAEVLAVLQGISHRRVGASEIELQR